MSRNGYVRAGDGKVSVGDGLCSRVRDGYVIGLEMVMLRLEMVTLGLSMVWLEMK